MATYDYRCPECGQTLSLQLTFAEYEEVVRTGGVLCADEGHPDIGMKRVYGGIQVSIPSTFHD